MNSNLYISFQQLPRERWKYYSIAPEMDFGCFNHDSAYKFIRGTYDVGSKDRIFDVGFQQRFKQSGKHQHTVALYFLGCLLSEVINDSLREHLATFISGVGDDWYDFLYTWFLTCLYHDTAAIIEKNEWNVEFPNIDFYLGKYDVQYNVYEHCWVNPTLKPYTYSESLVKNYFRYRVEHCLSIDHGIIAGYLLYDRLVKNYNEAWEHCRTNHHNCYDCFYYKGLNWRKEHMSHFAIVADAIISHNIWRSENTHDSRAIYRQYGLNPLLYSKSNRIRMSDNPLLFFLGLLDTIEPLKFFSVVHPNVVLNSINIHANNENEINILIHDSILIANDWFEKIKSMEKWLAVTVYVSKNSVNIQLM